MGLSKRKYNNIISSFTDGAYEDTELQALMNELHENEVLTGIVSPIILDKIYEYLDSKLQKDIRTALNK